MKKIVLLVTTGAAAFIFLGLFVLPQHTRGGAVSLSEFSVENLTCTSCVNNIREALGSVRGVERVEVNLATNRVRAEFRPERIEPEEMARIITRAGYPARVARVSSPEEYVKQKSDQRSMADRYVARVGERLVSREEFARYLARGENDPAVANEGGPVAAAWKALLYQETAAVSGRGEQKKSLSVEIFDQVLLSALNTGRGGCGGSCCR